jgi:hypothetical protein
MITTGFNWLRTLVFKIPKEREISRKLLVVTHGGFSLRLDIGLQK